MIIYLNSIIIDVFPIFGDFEKDASSLCSDTLLTQPFIGDNNTLIGSYKYVIEMGQNDKNDPELGD